MDKISGKLTVYFEEPFWVGVFELVFDGNLSVCKITFGAEPKEYEVLDCVLKHYCKRKPSPAEKFRHWNKGTAGASDAAGRIKARTQANE